MKGIHIECNLIKDLKTGETTQRITEKETDFPDPSLEELKAELIKQLKEMGVYVVNNKIPLFKQINAALDIYDAATKAEVINWITKVKTTIDSIEQRIRDATSIEELRDIQTSLESIETTAEALTVK